MFIEWMHDLWLRGKAHIKHRQLDRGLAEKLDFHLAMREQKLVEQVMPPEEARDTSRRAFGNQTRTREFNRAPWLFPFLETLGQDVRYGLRQLRRNPGFTIVAVLTLALGIGGTTAIFNLIYSVALQPLPYKDADRLAVVVTHDPIHPQSDDWADVTPAEFLDFQEQNHAFDQVMGVVDVEDIQLMTGPNIAPAWFGGGRVTVNAFRVLGVAPIIGRGFTDDDAKPGAPPVVMLSYREWQKDFGGDPGILGKTIFLNHQPTTVIGVMTPRFWGLGGRVPSGWLPAVFTKAVPKNSLQFTCMIGHLKPGMTAAQASSDIAFLAKRFATAYPKQHPKGITFSVESFVESPQVSGTLGMLMGGVGLLLLIACVNVANLLLARASNREHEIAIRAAIGAGRVRLVRQLLIEGLLLACGGAFLGILLAWDLFKLVVSILPPWDVYSELKTGTSATNGWVLLFAVGISLASTLLFGLAPAVLAVKKDLLAPLKGSGMGTSETRGHHRLRNLLVVSEVVLSLVLLTGAGLLFRSFWTLRHLKLGYNIDNVLQAETKLPHEVSHGNAEGTGRITGTVQGEETLPQERYKTLEQKNQFHLAVLRRVRSLSGVASATYVWPWVNRVVWVPIEAPGQPGADSQEVWTHSVGDGFFTTFKIPLLQGRTFSEDEIYLGRPVMVVNRAFVDKYLAGVNPLGRQINLKKSVWFPQLKVAAYEIVGVVANTVQAIGFHPEVKPQIFLPFTVSGSWWSMLCIRAKGNPATLTKPVRNAFSSIDKELPVDIAPVRDDFEYWYVEPRLVMGVLIGFALLGMMLVCVGVYGVLSYAVTRRTQEIGVRMALGAQASDVRRMVLIWGLRWLAIGIGIGIPASIVLERVLRNRVWGITSVDPLTLVAVS
ncbi:MAG TPA: ABC transporter permease, partial [Terriglobia bacterium]|nr:ABC transporter permease [Terriglobia bacterium]